MGIDDDNKMVHENIKHGKEDEHAPVTTGSFNIEPAPTYDIKFYGSQPLKTYLTITPDGRLIPGDGLSDDEATQLVAKMLAEHYGREMERIRREQEGKSA